MTLMMMVLTLCVCTYDVDVMSCIIFVVLLCECLMGNCIYISQSCLFFIKVVTDARQLS